MLNDMTLWRWFRTDSLEAESVFEQMTDAVGQRRGQDPNTVCPEEKPRQFDQDKCTHKRWATVKMKFVQDKRTTRPKPAPQLRSPPVPGETQKVEGIRIGNPPQRSVWQALKHTL
jgi:hypothetical protein